jgi:acetoin utilization deacetylase AcuC-like enzyme
VAASATAPTAAGKAAATGAGAGKGYTINIPLPGDAGHDSMSAVWQRVIIPAAYRFKPDLILCSAGE